MKQYQIPEIDLVIVDLYPFSETVRQGATEQEIIEKIDIGGVSLIRAGAKNFNDVLVVAGSHLYGELLRILNEKGGFVSPEERKHFAADAFRITSGYDTDIFNYFNRSENINSLRISVDCHMPLRYGENPHQKAVFYGDLPEIFEQLSGKEVSFNNLLDIDAALSYISGLEMPSMVIVKHNNACGMACDESLTRAWTKALAGDPVSAFGGIIAANRTIDRETAEEINSIFFEVIIAPGYDNASLQILKQKKNRIILKINKFPSPAFSGRSALNGWLWQEKDSLGTVTDELMCVTSRKPDEREFIDLEFANRLVMHTKSNAIVIVRDRQLIGSGTGQTSRVDAVKQAIEKAQTFGFDTKGAVMASDAYFPFPDSITLAATAGVSAVIQPGGSVRDKESVEECDRNNIAMIFTGRRHFKH